MSELRRLPWHTLRVVGSKAAAVLALDECLVGHASITPLANSHHTRVACRYTNQTTDQTQVSTHRSALCAVIASLHRMHAADAVGWV